MRLVQTAIEHIMEVAKVPSFSTYEERLHPYVSNVCENIAGFKRVEAPGNNLIFATKGSQSDRTVALTSHLDKINHFGEAYPKEIPVNVTDHYLEGAMDNSVGVGVMLALATAIDAISDKVRLLLLFSEMEESKGLKEHPELLKEGGNGYESGMGAKRISKTCKNEGIIPDVVITVDTTPLFKGKPGVALYSKHWEYTKLDPQQKLIERTKEVEKRFSDIDTDICLANNTNDYLHYGFEFNKNGGKPVVSVALEPAIYPYHQKGERVFISDIERIIKILTTYLGQPSF